MSKTRILKSNPYKNTTLSSKVIHALASGKGVTWLDRVRIPYDGKAPRGSGDMTRCNCGKMYNPGWAGNDGNVTHQAGRFPANLLVSDDILNDGQQREGSYRVNSTFRKKTIFGIGGSVYTPGKRGYGDSGSYSRYFDLDKWWETLNENPKI